MKVPPHRHTVFTRKLTLEGCLNFSAGRKGELSLRSFYLFKARSCSRGCLSENIVDIRVGAYSPVSVNTLCVSAAESKPLCGLH